MRIIEIFNMALNNKELSLLSEELLKLLPLGACNGYLVEQAGMDYGHQQTA
jgi:hypothetical protein